MSQVRQTTKRSQRPAEFSEGKALPEATVRRWLKACGKGVRIFAGSRLVGPERIEIGDSVQIDEGVWIFAGEGVTLGDHVHLAFGSSISGGGRCEIGDFAGIGAGVRLVTGSDDVDGRGLTNPTVPTLLRSVHRGRVLIGPHAVVFTNSVVLPDVSVGEGAVVAAASLVHHSLSPWGIYAGNPLVQIGVRPKDEILRLAERLPRPRTRRGTD